MAYGRISKSDGTEMALGPDGWQYMEPQQLSQLVRAPGRWDGGVDNGITVADLLARMPQGDAPNVIGGGQSQAVQFDRTSPIDYMGRKGFRQADGRIIDANGTMIADLNGAARMQAQQNALAQQDADLKRRALLADLMEKNQKIYAGTPEGMREKARIEAETAQAKPLPVSALKQIQTEREAAATASNIVQDLEGVKGQIETEQLKLGPIRNAVSAAQNFTGFSSQDSRNYDSFKATLERLRNDSLRLNSGVQTEGDAIRAWNELLSNINDEKNVVQQIKRIQNLNERAKQLREMNIDAINANYGRQGTGPSMPAEKPMSGTVSAPVDPSSIKPGYRRGGHVYLGGDPAKQSSWKREQ